MSTIHSISKKPLFADYMMWGNGGHCHEKNISLVLLNRGARIDKNALFNRKFYAHFDSIISIEPPGSSPEVYEMNKNSSQFRFLVPQKELTPGEQIDLAATLISDTWFCVLWNDQILDKEMIPPTEIMEEESTIIYVPFLKDMRKKNPIPTMMVPNLRRKKLELKGYGNVDSGGRSFYPFDFVGIYHRQFFLEMGGFDNSFKNPYWQLIDFGARLLMFGKNIRLNPYFLVHYEAEIEPYREIFDRDYLLYVLKSQLIQQKGERFFISKGAFIRFFLRYAGKDWRQTVRECRQASALVKKYQSFYQVTLAEGVHRWGGKFS